jgi:hypothetical protein
MERLATELKVQNRTLKQIRRYGQVALYELYGPHGSLYGFELIVVKIRKAEESFGNFYPQRETYPTNEEWGSFGWSYHEKSREMAVSEFTRMANATLQYPSNRRFRAKVIHQ